MAFAIKVETRARAWELGTDSAMEQEMVRLGKIAVRPGGIYEVFSLEAREEKGQVARAGDFFKVDDRGFPHPLERASFLRDHQPLEGGWYEQAARPLKIWRREDPDCEEVRFLLDRGILRIRPDDPDRYFSADLWETEESAASDAVLVFFDVVRNPAGGISAVNFNFVDKTYFDKHYRVISL